MHFFEVLKTHCDVRCWYLNTFFALFSSPSRHLHLVAFLCVLEVFVQGAVTTLHHLESGDQLKIFLVFIIIIIIHSPHTHTTHQCWGVWEQTTTKALVHGNCGFKGLAASLSRAYLHTWQKSWKMFGPFLDTREAYRLAWFDISY